MVETTNANKRQNLYKNRYNVILFDLDGTISDPKEGIVNSIKYALSKFGIQEDDDKFLEKFIGPSLYDAFRDFYFFEGKELYTVVELYREYFSEFGMYQNKLYPGMRGLLDNLYDANKKLILATSKPAVFAREIVDYFELQKYFGEIFGSNLDGTKVSKAELIELALQRSNDNPVMIGDRKYDIIGAKENGISSIGVLYGYGSKEELSACEPDYLVESVDELKNVLL